MTEEISLSFDVVASPVGDIVMAATPDGLRRVFFYDEARHIIPSEWQKDSRLLAEATAQMRAYLKGELKQFDLVVDPVGTEFQLRVWAVLRQIPYGQPISYKELASRAGNERASRAVGNANGRNPLVIIQPCHRVIGSGNKLGGFSSGLHRKKYLLELEGVSLG